MSSEIGCDSYYCSKAPYWIRSSVYWLSNSSNEERIYFLNNINNGYCYSTAWYSDKHVGGVRPVLVMSKDDIVIDNTPVAVGDINEIGTVVTIGTEEFYTIGTEGDNVKLLSMYNLYVGSECTASSCTPYGEEATGIQDSTMIGHNGVLVRKGTIKFSNTKYWSNGSSSVYVYDNNSLLYNYIENYGNYLKNRDVKIEDARLINLTELESLGCSVSTYSCSNAPKWVTATSYWTGSNFSEDYLWTVYNTGSFDYNLYSNNDCFGVRPVIVISKI